MESCSACSETSEESIVSLISPVTHQGNDYFKSISFASNDHERSTKSTLSSKRRGSQISADKLDSCHCLLF